MKKIYVLLAISTLSGCASTDDVYKQTNLLNYEPEPKVENVLAQASPVIKSSLKDPDSLKNLKIKESYKCYASKVAMSDNLSPKYDYGYWCYNFSFRATNSYGGYVPNTEIGVFHKGKLLSINEVNETVRKIDDVYTWHSPTMIQ